MKRKLQILLMTALMAGCLATFAACGSGVTIGSNGNWIVDGADTGISAAGESGSSVSIGQDGYWYIDGVNTGVMAAGGGSEISIGENGHWFIDGVDTGYAVQPGDAQGLAFCPLDDGTYAVSVGNAKYLSSITVPASYNGRAVTAVGDGGFAGCTSLQAISLPESIARVGADAFEGCTALREISLPAGLVEIGAGAFAGCGALQSAFFAVRTGWQVFEGEEDAGVSLAAAELESGLIAAQMLTDTRCGCRWSRSQSAAA